VPLSPSFLHLCFRFHFWVATLCPQSFPPPCILSTSSSPHAWVSILHLCCRLRLRFGLHQVKKSKLRVFVLFPLCCCLHQTFLTFWCSCRFVIRFHYNVFSSSSPWCSTCVWVFISISIMLRWEFPSLCLDYVICAQQILLLFMFLCLHFVVCLCYFVHVLQVVLHFIDWQLFLAFFLHFVNALCWSVLLFVIYFLHFVFCWTFLALVFSLHWSTFCYVEAFCTLVFMLHVLWTVTLQYFSLWRLGFTLCCLCSITLCFAMHFYL
jgi:hypothetical protein